MGLLHKIRNSYLIYFINLEIPFKNHGIPSSIAKKVPNHVLSLYLFMTVPGYVNCFLGV